MGYDHSLRVNQYSNTFVNYNIKSFPLHTLTNEKILQILKPQVIKFVSIAVFFLFLKSGFKYF